MPVQDTVPIGGTGEVPATKMEPAAKHTHDTASKVAGSAAEGAKKVSENPANTTTLEHDKHLSKDLKGDGGTPSFMSSLKMYFSCQCYSPQDVLVPLLAAFIVMTYAYLSSRNLSGTSGSRFGILATLFLIMGEPILSKALAVNDLHNPAIVAVLGMGWLSWTLSALVTAVSGTAELLPKPEFDSKVVNLKSGQGRANNSFLLSRILRDLESEHAPKADGLTIAVLDAIDPTLSPPTKLLDQSALGGLQISLCVCAWLTHRNLEVTYIFSIGAFLFVAVSQLPAWYTQKFSARRDKGKNATYALMRGNGHKNVFIIRNTHHNTFNLEDLACAALTRYDYTSWTGFPVLGGEVFVLASALAGYLWIAAACMTLSTPAVIYLLAIMSVGTAANICTVALPNPPAAYGIPLETVEVIHGDKVMGALQALEQKYEGCGEPLLKEFFPAGVKDEDKMWFAHLKESRECKVEVVEEEAAHLTML